LDAGVNKSYLILREQSVFFVLLIKSERDFMTNDQELLTYVMAVLRRGMAEVKIPSYLFQYTSDSAKEEVKKLCDNSGVKIVAQP
jgi:hypothetical protein